MMEKTLRVLDPRQPLYMPVAIGNTDGSLDLGFEGQEGHETLDEALAFAAEQTEEHGGEWFVYECRPVKRVHRVSVVVEDVAS